MAQENIKDITLTSAGGTFLFDLFGTSQNVLEITSIGSVTLAADVVINRNIPPMGTLTDSYVKMRWTANVIPNGHTVTILGVTVNPDLLDKDFVIDCYNGPFGWKLKFLVDYDSLDSLFVTEDLIASDGASSVASTINTAGYQTLKTLTYTNVPFYNDGDKFLITIAGRFAANAHLKTIRVAVTDGIVSSSLGGTSYAYQGDFLYKLEFIACDISAGKYKTIQNITNGVQSSISVSSPSALPTYDYASSSWTFTCEAQESTPTGADINLYSFDVQLIRK